jgi:hypothetical protein
MIFSDAVERHDQIGEEAAILRRDRALVAFERQFVLLLTADLPILRHILGMLAHAAAGDAVFHLRHVEPDVGWTQPAKQAQAVASAARLKHAA